MTSELTIESKLFYRTDPGAVFADLTHALVQAFANTKIEIRPLLQTDADLVFAIGQTTLTIARAQRGLDLAPFKSASRPECATSPMPEVQDRLSRHRAAVGIRVTGPEHAAKTETRLALIYIATMQMLRLALPDLVHWAKSNTLYTIEEFRSSTGAHRPVHPRPAAALTRTRRHLPMSRAPIPAEWKGRPLQPGVTLAPVQQDIAPPLPGHAPGDSARPISRLRTAMNHSAVAGLTAPLSVGYLLQYLLPGARLG